MKRENFNEKPQIKGLNKEKTDEQEVREKDPKTEGIKKQILLSLEINGEKINEEELEEMTIKFVKEQENNLKEFIEEKQKAYQEEIRDWQRIKESFSDTLHMIDEPEDLIYIDTIILAMTKIEGIKNCKLIDEIKRLEQIKEFSKKMLEKMDEINIESKIEEKLKEDKTLLYTMIIRLRNTSYETNEDSRENLQEKISILRAKILGKDYDEEKFKEIINEWKEKEIDNFKSIREELEENISEAENRITELEKSEE